MFISSRSNVYSFRIDEGKKVSFAFFLSGSVVVLCLLSFGSPLSSWLVLFVIFIGSNIHMASGDSAVLFYMLWGFLIYFLCVAFPFNRYMQ